MANKHTARSARRAMRLLLAGLALGLLSAPAPAQTKVVYYQVAYANGKIEDLNETPRTDKGILSVLRIARTETPERGYEVISTDEADTGAAGKTSRRYLAWDGSAWVANLAPKKHASASKTKTLDMVEALGQETDRLQGVITALEGKLKDQDHAVAQAQRALDAGTGDKESLDKVRQQAEATLKALDAYRKQLAAVKEIGQDKTLPAQSGQISTLAPESPAPAQAKSVEEKKILPHHIQVWPVTQPSGGAYTVSMRHAEAGELGAFYYVAYADTNGDGVPDKLIARSPLAVAKVPGQWTSWSFKTDAKSVFVGNAWLHEEAANYCAPAPPDYQPAPTGIGPEVYISGFLGQLPNQRFTPFLSNIRVTIPPESTDEASPPTGVKILVKERQ